MVNKSGNWIYGNDSYKILCELWYYLV
jgi:hypothetical protein